MHKSYVVLLGLLIALNFTACSLKVPISSPKTSENSYVGDEETTIDMQFDSSLGTNHNVITGTFRDAIFLEHNKEVINPNSFIKEALQKELLARNLPVSINSSSDNKIVLDHFEILTHRATGYSPLVTISILKVNIKYNRDVKSFVSIVKRGKVPILYMDEVFDPCYNEPITILVKEIVAKINKEYFGYKNEKSKELKHTIISNLNKDLTYLDVYELGFSNEHSFIDFLKELSTSEQEYIRLAAISSIGTIGDPNQLNFLISINKKSKLWQDRAMALKSIGDLNTPESLMYLKERKRILQEKVEQYNRHKDEVDKNGFKKYKLTKDVLWDLKIISLYV